MSDSKVRSRKTAQVRETGAEDPNYADEHNDTLKEISVGHSKVTTEVSIYYNNTHGYGQGEPAVLTHQYF